MPAKTDRLPPLVQGSLLRSPGENAPQLDSGSAVASFGLQSRSGHSLGSELTTLPAMGLKRTQKPAKGRQEAAGARPSIFLQYSTPPQTPVNDASLAKPGPWQRSLEPDLVAGRSALRDHNREHSGQLSRRSQSSSVDPSAQELTQLIPISFSNGSLSQGASPQNESHPPVFRHLSLPNSSIRRSLNITEGLPSSASFYEDKRELLTTIKDGKGRARHHSLPEVDRQMSSHGSPASLSNPPPIKSALKKVLPQRRESLWQIETSPERRHQAGDRRSEDECGSASGMSTKPTLDAELERRVTLLIVST